MVINIFDKTRPSKLLQNQWAKVFYNADSNTYFKRGFSPHINISDYSLRVTKSNLTTTLLALKYDWYKQFSSCMDIIAYDQPGKTYRFTIIYYLLSITYNVRMQLITQTSDLKGVDTAVSLYKSANWSEREVYDMYGIMFWQHPDLRRILTDYGFS